MSTAETSTLTRRIHLSAAGVSLVLDVSGSRIPAVLHWGAALGTLDATDAAPLVAAGTEPVANNVVDVPMRLGLLPQNADGWVGHPGLTGAFVDGSGFSTRFVTRRVLLDGQELTSEFAAADAGLATFELTEPDLGLDLDLEVELLPSGLVRLRGTLANAASQPFDLDEFLLALPVPLDATELLDFAGRWGKERVPQRTVFTVGVHQREGRHGRTGADAAHVLHAGTPGFSFRSGEIWAVHTAFSGNHLHLAEKHSNGKQLLAGGELLLPVEGRIQPGEDYRSPWVYGNYAPDGLDTVAHRFHRYLRHRDQHGGMAAIGPDRPVTLNVWEAVYFDHDLDRLTDLADRAAELGVERYVLDDGWFGARRNDHAGLGDWVVSEDVWPSGLSPLIDHVRGLGMQFGLWFEPEMVNEDSDVARAHPEWIMAPGPHRLPLRSRHQQVLNLAIPGAWQHVHDQMQAILDEYPIDYIKWDHNRDLIESGDRTTGRAATHQQTLATYRLFRALKEAHPGLEIESCASGGGRVDLGILEVADRVWVSDCIDPLERQQMNRWTSQLLPLEYMGSHVASGASHTTGRLHTLGFRAGTSLFGHFGIEWDLATATEEELDELGQWIELYKAERDLLLTGDLVRADRGEDSLWLSGVVAPDRSRALYSLAAVERSDLAPLGRLRFPGLDPDRRYRLRPLSPGKQPHGLQWPAWAVEGADVSDGFPGPVPRRAALTSVDLPGGVLVHSGVTAPAMSPETVVLFSLEEMSDR